MIFLTQALVGGDDRAPQIRACLHDAFEPHARQPLDDQPQAAVRQLEHLVDVGGGADRIEILEQRLFDRRFTLREDANHPPRRGRLVDQTHRGFAGHRQRHERVRKKHGVSKRQHRQLARNREWPLTTDQQCFVETVGLIGFFGLIGLIAHWRSSHNEYVRLMIRGNGRGGAPQGGPAMSGCRQRQPDTDRTFIPAYR